MRKIKNILISTAYSAANCIPPAPIMLINILPLFKLEHYRKKRILFPTLAIALITAAFAPFQINSHTDINSYIISYLALVFIFFTSISAAFYFSNQTTETQESLIRKSAQIIIFVFFATTLATIATGNPEIVGSWYAHYLTSGVTAYRYGGFMYEASHFCLVAAPLYIYLISKPNKNNKTVIYIILLTIPLLFSLSIGFLFTFIATLLITTTFRTTTVRKYLKFTLITTVIATSLITTYSLVPPIKTRVDNILAGNDSSTKGRTYEAYLIATIIAKKNNILTGIGPGQIKSAGRSEIIEHYKYNETLIDTVRIPASSAEVLASYGAIGLFLKILLLIIGYIRCKVYQNRFSNFLFIFFFAYQFYGSFILSSIEIFSFALSYYFAIKHKNIIHEKTNSNTSIQRP